MEMSKQKVEQYNVCGDCKFFCGGRCFSEPFRTTGVEEDKRACMYFGRKQFVLTDRDEEVSYDE